MLGDVMPESSPGDQTTTAVEDNAAANSDVNQTATDTTSTGSENEGQNTQGSIADAVKAALAPKTEGEGSPTSETQDSTKAEKPDAKTEDELPEEVPEDEL